MIHYVKATKRPSIRFSSAIESVVYSLVPESPSTTTQIVGVVLNWLARHPEDGPIRSAREIQLIVDNLVSAGWLRASLAVSSKSA
jgi:hypothetical protein